METGLWQSPKGAPARARVNGEGGAIRTSGMRERVRVRMGVSGPDRSGRAPHAAWRPHTFGPSARLGHCYLTYLRVCLPFVCRSLSIRTMIL